MWVYNAGVIALLYISGIYIFLGITKDDGLAWAIGLTGIAIFVGVTAFLRPSRKIRCPQCLGHGEYEKTIGGDGYGGRCCGLMDVPVVCDACEGTGKVQADEI
jgi:DnaJ-class molecular chaperone